MKPYNIIKPYDETKTNNRLSNSDMFKIWSGGYRLPTKNDEERSYKDALVNDPRKVAEAADSAKWAAAGAAGAAQGALGGLGGNSPSNTNSANKYDALYTGNSFKDWYKTHYGSNYTGQSYSRPEGMNDLDWDIGRTLYDAYQREQALTDDYNKKTNYYKQMYNSQQSAAEEAYNNYLQNIEQAYKASVGSLDNDRSSSQQAASIMLDKAMKYLPEQLKAQGLGGLGVSSSAMLEANNNYINQLGSIMELYNQNKGALDLGHSNDLQELANGKLDSDTQRYNQYISSLMSLEDAYNANMLSNNTQSSNNVTDLLNNYRELEREEQDREYAAQDQTANNALFVLESMRENPNYTDENGNLTKDGYKRMSDYFASISSALDEPTKKMLKNYLQGWAPDTTSSGSGIKDSSEKEITDYTVSNIITVGRNDREILYTGNIADSGDAKNSWDSEGKAIWVADDGDGNTGIYELGKQVSAAGEKYKAIVNYITHAKAFLGAKRGTPERGDAVMYDGELYIFGDGGKLFKVTGGAGDSLDKFKSYLYEN